jgi:hypothetical protein
MPQDGAPAYQQLDGKGRGIGGIRRFPAIRMLRSHRA